MHSTKCENLLKYLRNSSEVNVRLICLLLTFSFYMPISSQALGKTREGSETKDTKVSLQEATPRTGDDIVRTLLKSSKEE